MCAFGVRIEVLDGTLGRLLLNQAERKALLANVCGILCNQALVVDAHENPSIRHLRRRETQSVVTV